MSRWNAGKKTYEMAKRLKKQRGGSALWYLFDAVSCGYRHHASWENYFVLRFYELDEEERGTYLTSGRSAEADRKLNRLLRPEQAKILSHKHLLYERFSDYVRRDWIYVPDVSYEEFSDFLSGREEVIVKPDRGIMGRGVRKLAAREIEDPRELFETCRKEGLLMEQAIVQHEDLNRISACVNSVRINAARDREGNVRLIGACLKCGAPGATADNFHSGGVAYPLDLETGKVAGPGRNNREIKDYTHHPGSSVLMPGFTLPCWEQVRACALGAMEEMPELGYVGWDIAATPCGAELIEGNCRWPGGNIIQLDGIGKYPLIKECLEGVSQER